MIKVNVAALKAELSKYLDMVQKGEQVIVTSHGEEIAKIGPTQIVVSSAVNWKAFFAKRPAIKAKKRGMSGSSLIRQIRDED